MLLSPDEIKEQTRQLWRTCFDDTEDFMDIYFSEKYTDDSNLTIRHNGQVVAAMQLLPYRVTFYGAVQHAGYVSGLATLPAYRGKGYASNLLHEAHRRLFRQGATLSFLIPADEAMRKFYEKPEHGAYWTAVYRQELPLDVTKDGTFDKIEVTRPDEWPQELFVFYRRLTAELPFMVHPSENDFFAGLEAADLADGYVLVARRKQRMVGLCVAVKEASGKVYIRTLAITETAVRAAFVDYLCRACQVEQVYRRFSLPGSLKETKPYAMARIINVPRFLANIAHRNPGFQLHIGVDGDLDIPENNGWYMVENGRVRLTDVKPDSIITPGGLAAMFMAAQPMVMDLLLDE